MIISTALHVGHHREKQEDFILIDEELGLYCVADGIGGHGNGDVASKMACETVYEVCLDAGEYSKDLPFKALQEAHYQLSDAASANLDFQGMGTTMVMGMVVGRLFHIAWLGDSRAYKITQDSISQLTRDHTEAEKLIDEGVSFEEAYSKGNSHKLTAAVAGGLHSFHEPGEVKGQLARGETLLMCSDGLYNELSDQKIAEIILSHGVEQGAEALVSEVLKNGFAGARDNIAVVLLGEG